jgi:hypothetical protein
MPRWIYRREKPDYSHLHGRPLSVILDGAIANRPYGADVPTFAATVNADLLSWFAGREVLTASEALATMEPTRGMRGWSEEFVCDWVGTRLGWGMHLGILDEAAQGPDGERAWTMPDREPAFDVHNKRARRIRGLPPAEQIAMDKRRAREAKLRATLDTKHARQVAPRVVDLLDRITGSEPDAVMPAVWAPFVGADIMERWPTFAEARGLLVDVHHRMDRERQRTWLRHLEAAADAASFYASRREGERQAAADLAEDADAFAGL